MQTFIIKVSIWAIVFGIAALKFKWKKEVQEDMVSNISGEQKAKLEASKVDFIQNNEWIQPGLVYEVDGSNVKVLWYNRTIQESFYREIRCSEVKVKRAEQKEHNLQAGDFVKIHFKNGKVTIF